MQDAVRLVPEVDHLRESVTEHQPEEKQENPKHELLKARRKAHCRGNNKGTVFYVRGKSLRPGVEEAGKLHLVPQQHPKSKQSPAGVTSIEAAAEEA